MTYRKLPSRTAEAPARDCGSGSAVISFQPARTGGLASLYVACQSELMTPSAVLPPTRKMPELAATAAASLIGAGSVRSTVLFVPSESTQPVIWPLVSWPT